MDDVAFRRAHVGASEVAALFDCHPHLTRFQLWHRKNGTLPEPDLSENERVLWGTVLEPAIIGEACRRYGWERDRARKRLTNGGGLGGHMDASAICPTRGPGVLEIKTADWLVAKGWGDEPPLNYLLQAQTYMGLSRRPWGALVALVGGNDLRMWPYDFRPTLYAEIEKRVAAFWASIAAGDEPKPDFARDGDAILEIYDTDDGGTIDLSTDNRAPELVRLYQEGKAQEKAGKEQADAAKAELIEKMGAATTAKIGEITVTAKRTKDSLGTLVTAGMVGTYVGGRAGSRRLTIKETSNG